MVGRSEPRASRAQLGRGDEDCPARAKQGRSLARVGAWSAARLTEPFCVTSGLLYCAAIYFTCGQTYQLNRRFMLMRAFQVGWGEGTRRTIESGRPGALMLAVQFSVSVPVGRSKKRLVAPRGAQAKRALRLKISPGGADHVNRSHNCMGQRHKIVSKTE